MKPEELVLKMREQEVLKSGYSFKGRVAAMLRVVLKHIQEGEVVEPEFPNGIILKPDFQKFMEEKV